MEIIGRTSRKLLTPLDARGGPGFARGRWFAPFLLSGCAALNGGLDAYAWRPSPTWPALRPVWVVVGQEGLRARCGSGKAACVKRDLEIRVCFIYAERSRIETPRWLVEHEWKHCEGYDHA